MTKRVTCMKPYPAMRPSTGDARSEAKTSMTFDQLIPAVPSAAMPAPSNPPTSACDEPTGNAQIQVMRSHTIAPNSAAMTRCAVASAAWITPPMVSATAMPMTRGPMKLNMAASMMAVRGFSAPV